MTPPLDSHSTTEPKLEILSAVSTRNRICRLEISMRHCEWNLVQKKLLFKDDLSIII